MRRRDLLAGLTGVGAVALAGCAGESDGADADAGESEDTETDDAETTESAAPEADATVSTDGLAFAPQRISVDPGETVAWRNEGATAHDVTAATYTDDAVNWEYAVELPGGESRAHTFEDAGVYQYYCTIHGETSMCGAVLVGDVSLASGALPCESGDGGPSDGDDGGYY
jgi:plastocyanin